MTIFGKVFFSASLAKAMKADDDWQPPAGMAKAMCAQCKKPFAYRVEEWATVPLRCANCKAVNKPLAEPGPFDPGGGGAKPSKPKRHKGDGH